MTRLPRTRTLLVAVTALLAVGMLASPAGAREVGSKVKVEGRRLPAGGDAIGTPDDPAIGRTAPTITGVGFDGEKVSFANGAPRILLFLSHSCPHCQDEVPRIVKLEKKGRLDGVAIETVTTNTDEDLPNYPPSKWLSREKWPFDQVLADDARLRAFVAFGGEAFPYFVFIDAAGSVVARATGELRPAVLADAAERLVAGESLFE